MTTEPGYQGWTNKPTWAVSLWLNNDEPLYRRFHACRSVEDVKALAYNLAATPDPRDATWRGFMVDLARAGMRDADADVWETFDHAIEDLGEGQRSALRVVTPLVEHALTLVNWQEIAEDNEIVKACAECGRTLAVYGWGHELGCGHQQVRGSGQTWETLSLADFITRAGITMAARELDPTIDQRRYTVTLRRAPSTSDRRTLRTPFRHGYGIAGVELPDVIDCLLSDAAGFENARGFDEWCAEYGFEPDSRKVWADWQAIEKQAKKLRAFLGSELYELGLWHVER